MSRRRPVQERRDLEADREREDLRNAALRLIEELGGQAGYLTALVARLPTLAPDARERLLAIVDAIQEEQGFGWCFPQCGGDGVASLR